MRQYDGEGADQILATDQGCTLGSSDHFLTIYRLIRFQNLKRVQHSTLRIKVTMIICKSYVRNKRVDLLVKQPSQCVDTQGECENQVYEEYEEESFTEDGLQKHKYFDRLMTSQRTESY